LKIKIEQAGQTLRKPGVAGNGWMGLKTFFSPRKSGRTDFKLSRRKESLLLPWQI
jgi:hypothetical protein